MTADPSEVVFLCADSQCGETAKGLLNIYQVVGFWSSPQQIYGLRLPAGWSTHLFKERTLRGHALTALVAVFCPKHTKERIEDHGTEKPPTTPGGNPTESTNSGTENVDGEGQGAG